MWIFDAAAFRDRTEAFGLSMAAIGRELNTPATTVRGLGARPTPTHAGQCRAARRSAGPSRGCPVDGGDRVDPRHHRCRALVGIPSADSRRGRGQRPVPRNRPLGSGMDGPAESPRPSSRAGAAHFDAALGVGLGEAGAAGRRLAPLQGCGLHVQLTPPVPQKGRVPA